MRQVQCQSTCQGQDQWSPRPGMGMGMAALGTSNLTTYHRQGLMAQVLSLNAALWADRVEALGEAGPGH